MARWIELYRTQKMIVTINSPFCLHAFSFLRRKIQFDGKFYQTFHKHSEVDKQNSEEKKKKLKRNFDHCLAERLTDKIDPRTSILVQRKRFE